MHFKPRQWLRRLCSPTDVGNRTDVRGSRSDVPPDPAGGPDLRKWEDHHDSHSKDNGAR